MSDSAKSPAIRGVCQGFLVPLAAVLAILSSPANAGETVRLATTWYAQAEHGGFYQAVAEGIYEKYGLDVEIKMGGPQVNNSQLLMAGVVDFAIGYPLKSLNAVREGLPMVTVAAFFQKDPQSLVVHEGQGFDSIEKLKGHPIKVPTAGRVNYWPWLVTRYGFSDDQLRPYEYSYAALKNDPTTVQQGYITNDGYFLQQADIAARSLHLADYGWNAYAATLDTRAEVVDEKPEMVEKFIRASIEGWQRYMQNPAPADALIKKDNPEQNDALLAHSRKAMQRYGILGPPQRIGLMTQARWRGFYDDMVAAGTLPADMDYDKAYTLRFVERIYPDLAGEIAGR
jgi:NitT/TauT family transport system substrate-binding protein